MTQFTPKDLTVTCETLEELQLIESLLLVPNLSKALTDERIKCLMELAVSAMFGDALVTQIDTEVNGDSWYGECGTTTTITVRR